MVNHIPRSTMLFGQLLLLFFIQTPMASAVEPSAPSTSSPEAICDIFPRWPGCGITKCQRWKTCGPCTGISCEDWDEDRDGGNNYRTIGENRPAPPNNVVTPSVQDRTGTEPGSGRLRRGVHRNAPAAAAESKQRDHRSNSAQTIRDHRKQAPRTGHPLGLQAPSDLVIRPVSPTAMVLAWQDNATDEFGVEVQRAVADELRRDPNAWTLIGTFEERIDANVKGTGPRTDEDAELTPGDMYCYRLRSYSGFERTQVSEFSGVACAQTASQARD